MKIMISKDHRRVLVITLIILLSCCLFPTKQENVRMISRLMGRGKTMTKTGEVWEGDLGVMFTHKKKLYLLIGDTIGSLKYFLPILLLIQRIAMPKMGLISHG